MNQKLKFSWGHIIAFIVLIYIAYVVFMGITYYTLGNYILAGIGSAICVILLIVTLIGAQIIKGAATKFYKAIIWERILLFLSIPVIFLVFIPYNHFWSVQSQEEAIIENFKTAIESSRGIFTDYDAYVDNRVQNLHTHLDRTSLSESLKKNRIEELTLVLSSENYKTLKNDANSWIDNASASPSVWNVFLFGNIDNIVNAIDNWTIKLNNISTKKLNSEEYEVEAFSIDNNAKKSAISTLENLKSIYTKKSGISLMALLTLAICYILLYFPYFIQERNARNCERFWDFSIFSSLYSKETNNENGDTEYIQPTNPRVNNPENNNETNINMPRKPRSSKGAPV